MKEKSMMKSEKGRMKEEAQMGDWRKRRRTVQG